MAVGILVVAAACVLLRQTRPVDYPSRVPADMQILLPVTFGERAFWMFASASAGICEELVYRGFGLCALRGNGVPTWLAIILVSLAFVLIHGLFGLRRFRRFFTVGVLYSSLFLWVHSLTPGILIHTLYDMMFILAG
jgi:membrane protease YdiL (CAAX protease family)